MPSCLQSPKIPQLMFEKYTRGQKHISRRLAHVAHSSGICGSPLKHSVVGSGGIRPLPVDDKPLFGPSLNLSIGRHSWGLCSTGEPPRKPWDQSNVRVYLSSAGGVHLEAVKNIASEETAFLAATSLIIAVTVTVAGVGIAGIGTVTRIGGVAVVVAVVVAIVVTTSATSTAVCCTVDHDIGNHGNNDDNDNENCICLLEKVPEYASLVQWLTNRRCPGK